MTGKDSHAEQKSDPGSIEPSLRSTIKPQSSLSPGERIGRYTIKSHLGEGGFATVYLAEQTEPVKRRVALKINKAGMDTGQFLARFEAERQALAMMDHPNVAMVFDAGETETGRSYFVMEYVPGEAITDYCDHHTLSTRDRLGLFMQVCSGVQHAHQKGIIHRDIKPSNVLVSVAGGTPLVKVIDFGVAKSIGRELTDKTIFTEFGQIIGTPEYMSPEQAEMSVLDVDTRTDIYSLGVLLYELLVGALPFDPQSLRKAAFGEIQRIIREEEPQKPSTRLSTLGDQSDLIASKHHTNTRMLARELRGELDWITMKALEKDRARRYSSASELVADIERYFHDEPVLAGPPSAAYRFSKFVRKNKLSVTVSVVVFLAIVTSLGGVIIGSVNAARERDRAEMARLEAENEKLINAESQRFLDEISMLFSLDEARSDGTMAEILHNATERLVSHPPANPEVEAAIRRIIANFYINLGQYDQALSHLMQFITLLTQSRGATHPKTVETWIPLAECLALQGNPEEAHLRLREAIKDVTGSADEQRELRFRLLHALGRLLNIDVKHSEAEVVCREAYQLATELYGEEAPATFAVMELLGYALYESGQTTAYEELSTRMWVMLESLPAEQRNRVHLEIESLKVQLRLLLGDGEIGPSGKVILDRGRGWTNQQAMKLADRFRDQHASLSDSIGEGHLRTLAAQRGLATMLHRARKYAEAEPVWRAYLEAQPKPLEQGDEDVAVAIGFLALGRWRQGDEQEAEQLYARLDGMLRARSFENVDLNFQSYYGFGKLLASQSRFTDAEPMLLECYRAVHMLEEPDVRITFALMDLVELYESLGREEEVAKYSRLLAEAPQLGGPND